MHLLIVLAVTIVAVMAYYAMLAGTVAGARIDAGVDKSVDKLKELGQRFHLILINNVFPAFRKAAVVAIVLVVLGFLNGVYLILRNDAEKSPVTATLAAGALLIVMVCSVYALRWERAKAPHQFSAISLGSTVFFVFLVNAFAYLLVGAAIESTAVVISGAGFFLCAETILFVFLSIGSWLVALGIEIAEGGSSYLLRLAVQLIASGKKGLEALKDVKAEIANEQAIREIPNMVQRRIRGSVYPVFAFTILAASVRLVPTPVVLGLMVMVGMVVYFIYGTLEANFISTLVRRQMSALLIEKVGMFLLLLAVVTVVIPEARETVLALASAVKGLVILGLAHVTKVLKDHPVLLLVILSLGFAAWTLRSEMGHKIFGTKLSGMSAWVAGFACLLGFVFLIFLQARGPITGAAEEMSKTVTKGVFPTTRTTDRGTVLVSWPAPFTDPSAFSSVRIERRGIQDPTFSPVQTLSSGATTYEDDGVSRGKTYFYRVVFTDSSGKDLLTTDEKEVSVPKASAPVSASRSESEQKRTVNRTSSRTIQPAESRDVAECPNGSCGQNAALAELCRRHPHVAECQ